MLGYHRLLTKSSASSFMPWGGKSPKDFPNASCTSRFGTRSRQDRAHLAGQREQAQLAPEREEREEREERGERELPGPRPQMQRG